MYAPIPHTDVSSATSSDMQGLGRIWLELMRMHEQSDPTFALARDGLDRWQQMTAEMLARHDSFVMVARNDGQPIGFCIGWVARNPPIYQVTEVGFISEIAVTASCRRRGVGRALIAAAQGWFTERGLHEFQLSTAVWNHDAQAFWRALGGKPLLVRFQFAMPLDRAERSPSASMP